MPRRGLAERRRDGQPRARPGRRLGPKREPGPPAQPGALSPWPARFDSGTAAARPPGPARKCPVQSSYNRRTRHEIEGATDRKAGGLRLRRPPAVDGVEPPDGAVDSRARTRSPRSRLERRADRLRLGLPAETSARRPPAPERRPPRGFALRAPRPQLHEPGEPHAPDPGRGLRHPGRPFAPRRGARPQAPVRDVRVARGPVRVRPGLPGPADPAHRAVVARTGARLRGSQGDRRQHAPAAPLGQHGRPGGADAPLRPRRGGRAVLGDPGAAGRADRAGGRALRPPTVPGVHPQAPGDASPATS